MLQNLKVDIVYYKTNTDFEMEFNLCGCCRMRLLTDKASDKKTLIHDLARAVSRSRVIIIAGKLSGEEGIIEITARSIAKTVTQIDNSLYGIKTKETIGIINGATPLVTPDGDFGGCIIESGPQSMILLSEDRAIRKTVMHTLIHPYIEELCAIELKAKAESAAAHTPAVIAPAEPPADNTPEKNGEASEINDSSEEKTENATEEAESRNETEKSEDTKQAEIAEDKYVETAEPESETGSEGSAAKPLSSFTSKTDDISLSGGMIFETDDYRASAESFKEEEDSELFIESEGHKKSRPVHYNNSFTAESEENSPYQAPYDSNKKLKIGLNGNLPILIISVLLLIIIAVLCYCIFYVPAKDGITAVAYLSETFNTLFG